MLLLSVWEQKGNSRWNSLDIPKSELYAWDEKSTYIKHPPFFQTMVGHHQSVAHDDGNDCE